MLNTRKKNIFLWLTMCGLALSVTEGSAAVKEVQEDEVKEVQEDEVEEVQEDEVEA